jgi:hypothetical protein
MASACFALTAVQDRPAVKDRLPPVAHWRGDGTAVDSVHEIEGQLYGGARFAPAVVGEGFLFDGADDALNIPDDPRLRYTKSLTINAWIKAFAYPDEAHVAGQIVFRGDERSGLDSYHLTLHHDGTLYFTVESETDIAHVKAPFPLGRFVHVSAALDDTTGLLRLMYGRKVMSETITPVRPLGDLDPNASPGIGIGNHGRQPESIHHQPFKGIIDELTLSGRTTLGLESLSLGAPHNREINVEVRLAVPAPPGGAKVTLSATEPGIPDAITIEQGKTRAGFRISARPDLPGVTVTARYNGSQVSASRAFTP